MDLRQGLSFNFQLDLPKDRYDKMTKMEKFLVEDYVLNIRNKIKKLKKVLLIP